LGEQWHQRLRGHEVDDVTYDLKTVGRQYVLEDRSLSHDAILQRLHHLCESVGAKLRSQGKQARGVLVYAKTTERGYWHARHMCDLPFFSDNAIYAQAMMLFAQVPSGSYEIGISCYELSDGVDDQLSFFGDSLAREQQVTEAIDAINKRFGDRTIHAADTLGTGSHVKQKIPFGSTRYL
jgi:DNA polymerase IV